MENKTPNVCTNNAHPCTCPNLSCKNHGKCCDCVRHHQALKNTPNCFQK